jgi:hypothetical protein
MAKTIGKISMIKKSNSQYFIEYLKDGMYVLLGKNPLNNSNIVLAKSDSPSKLLEHGYLDLHITQPIDMSTTVSAIMELETIASMGGIQVHDEMMGIIQKLIDGVLNKKLDEENYYE